MYVVWAASAVAAEELMVAVVHTPAAVAKIEHVVAVAVAVRREVLAGSAQIAPKVGLFAEPRQGMLNWLICAAETPLWRVSVACFLSTVEPAVTVALADDTATAVAAVDVVADVVVGTVGDEPDVQDCFESESALDPDADTVRHPMTGL